MKLEIMISISLIIIIINSENQNEIYDLVIIGSGLAGLTAAYEAYLKSNNTLKIALIEQLPFLGGNSKRATSGINLLETVPQKANNVKDNYTIFYTDTMRSGKKLNDPNLLDAFSIGKKDLYHYYTSNFDIDIQLLGQLGGHSVARTHRPTDSNFVIGFYLISKITEKIKEIKNIKIFYNSTVVKLLKNETNNKIYGLKYKKKNIHKEKIIYCDAIILTTGGFAHDFGENGLLKEFAPQIMKFPSTNGHQSTGSGIKLGREIGADLVDMEQIQVHPSGFVDPKNRFSKDKFLAPELLRGVGGILINEYGERFCNELGTRDYVTNKIKENCKKQDIDKLDQYECFLLMNEKMAIEFGHNFNYYKNVKGFILEHKNFYELAKHINVDFSKLEDTIKQYNDAYDKNIDQFNKTTFSYKFDINNKIYSMVITPSIHYTMGGLRINSKAEVININGNKIYGLYAAGEVTGGVHGGNRLGGNSLAECGVFGRIAADSAFNYISEKNYKFSNIKYNSILEIIYLGFFELFIVAFAFLKYYKRRNSFDNYDFGNDYLL